MFPKFAIKKEVKRVQSQYIMRLPVKLQKELVDFLLTLPNIQDSDGQRALIYNAGLDPQLQSQIPFGKPPAQFVPIIISTLLNYGKLHDGRYALEAILETAKDSVGLDKKLHCETLLKGLQANLKKDHQQIFREKIKRKGTRYSILVLVAVFLVVSILLLTNRIVQLNQVSLSEYLVKGHVRSVADYQAIDGVEISIVGREEFAISDNAGNFTLHIKQELSIPIRLRASRRGFRVWERTIAINKQPIIIQLYLE